MKTIGIAWAIALVAATSVTASTLPEPDAPRLNPPDESAIQLTLHVRADAKLDGDGSKQSPFVAVQEAIDAAVKSAEPARILVGPGIYRETLNIGGSDGGEPHLLVLEAEESGTAVISGSDVFSEWEPVPDVPGRFAHPWKLKIGWEKNPWPGLMPMDSEGLRHELLFVDAKPSQQVLKEGDLREGTYYVDEDKEHILLQLGEEQTPAGLNIEVSVRPVKDRGDHSKLVRIFKRDNVVLRGLVVQHAMNPMGMAALQILASSNIVVEDCRVEWNSGSGIAINPHDGTSATNVVLRKLRVDNNGFIGLTGGFQDGLIEDVTTNENNWRGVMVGATGWAPCGWKLSGLDRVVLRRMQAIGNHASGGWLDDHITNVVIEDFTSMNNLRAGLSVEAVVGPLVVRNAFLAGNSVGFNLFDSRNVALVDSVIVDNLESQVKLSGSIPMEPEELAKVQPNWRRERLSKRQVPSNVTLSANKVGVTGLSTTNKGRLLEFGMRDHAFTAPDGTQVLTKTIETLQSSGATYTHPDGDTGPVFPDLSGRTLQLEDWQNLSDQDADARFDVEAVQTAREEGEKKSGFSIKPYAAPDSPSPADSKADALEL